jgi:hypothetical protein
MEMSIPPMHDAIIQAHRLLDKLHDEITVLRIANETLADELNLAHEALRRAFKPQ